ncbi:MAG: glycosyltransferase family 4 protein [Myxococcales bacterium]|nr:glycosyltransferase family 4 protein [Myxococcales bacterium]
MDGSMARILVTGFCAVPGPSRAGVQVRHVVRALASHVVDLLVVREADQPYVERQGNGRLLRVPTHDADLRSQVQAYQRALRRQLEGADYDVVHCRDAWGAAAVLEARDRFGYAVVFDLTRGSDDRSDLDAELAAQLDRDEEACLLAADLVLVPTEAAHRYALGRGLPDRVVLSPPGVDVDRFDWDEASVAGPPLILYVGAIGPGRGIRTLLRAMAEVAKTAPSRLAMVGPVARGFEGPLKAAIAELGLTGRIELRPAVDHEQMPALIATAGVCVIPAAPDLSPRPYALYPTRLLEFMACRRAVVAPRRGSVGMLIDHGREGLLFAPGDHIDLARKVRRLIDDAGLRERLAANGYDRVRREFTASAARRAIRTAYAELADRPEWRGRMTEQTTGSHGLPNAIAVGDPIAVDDEFEATVYEVAPTSADPSEVVIDVTLDPASDDVDAIDRLGPPTATGLARRSTTTDDGADLDAALATLDADNRDHFTEERVLPPSDETQERSVDVPAIPASRSRPCSRSIRPAMSTGPCAPVAATAGAAPATTGSCATPGGAAGGPPTRARRSTPRRRRRPARSRPAPSSPARSTCRRRRPS